MTADETAWPMLFDFITGKYNNIVCSADNGSFKRYCLPGFTGYFLRLHRQGVSTKMTGEDFGS